VAGINAVPVMGLVAANVGVGRLRQLQMAAIHEAFLSSRRSDTHFSLSSECNKVARRRANEGGLVRPAQSGSKK
jgi:hypothetical protein